MPSTPSALPPNWREVIAHVEQAVANSLEDLRRRERALDKERQTAEPQWKPVLEELQSNLQGLEKLADRARAVVQESDAKLAAGEAVLQEQVERARHLNLTLSNQNRNVRS